MHHKDWDHDNNSEDNLADLCQRCHDAVHAASFESYGVLQAGVRRQLALGDAPRRPGESLRDQTNGRGLLRCSLDDNCGPAIVFEAQVQQALGHGARSARELAGFLDNRLECAKETAAFWDAPRRPDDRGGRFHGHLVTLVARGALADRFVPEPQVVVLSIDEHGREEPVEREVERGWWKYSIPPGR